VNLLLDTHALLWYALDDQNLSSTAKSLIVNPANDIWMSPVSFWEMAIKISIGKLKLHRPFSDFIDVCTNQYKFRLLPILPAHANELITLAFPPNHKDPFDRLLVAQAIVERMDLISNDHALDAYPVKRHWN
jgi:PIN domain nuclease of toxin-antitoxin system